MSPALLRILLICAATLTVATASVVSAEKSAPSEPRSPGFVAYLLAGGMFDSLCGDAPRDHDHHCPFCRLLDDAPGTVLSGRVDTLRTVALGLGLTDQAGIPQSANPRISPRAPPARA